MQCTENGQLAECLPPVCSCDAKAPFQRHIPMLGNRHTQADVCLMLCGCCLCSYLFAAELPRGGKGSPTSYTGLIWGGFRPSDDAQVITASHACAAHACHAHPAVSAAATPAMSPPGCTMYSAVCMRECNQIVFVIFVEQVRNRYPLQLPPAATYCRLFLHPCAQEQSNTHADTLPPRTLLRLCRSTATTFPPTCMLRVL